MSLRMKTILVANLKGGCGKTMTAITLASAFAQQGLRIGIADADPQKSSLQWLKYRPESAAKIVAVDWRNEKSIGHAPENLDYLIVDAPGALSGEHAEQLISESHAIVTPLQPSVFDIDSTKRFLKHLKDIKRIRKGKVQILLLGNRLRPNTHSAEQIKAFFQQIEQIPAALILERSCYDQLAQQGLALFDKPQKQYTDIQAQWQPLLNKLLQDA
ncbi:ParA family protein [Vitreoscilla sp. C1]|uniref:ParA family protein n=1 Tax=Vitreoscilla sp. (strain C1) TaxID=96942 RepID=UPI001C0FCB8C|nr:ParA family protein [Vitreoscilla sp. C1]